MRYLVLFLSVMFLLSSALYSNYRTEAAFEELPPSLVVRGPGTVQNPHLYHAEAGARWLMSITIEPSPGIYKWYNSDLVATTFMTEQSMGVVGVGKFFLMLYNATGNATYLEYAEGAGKWLISLAEPTAIDAYRWSKWEGLNEYDPDHYGGIGSTIEYLLLLHQVTDDPVYLEYAVKGANWLIDEAVPVGAGYKWRSFSTINYNMTGWYHGTAGISFVLYELYEETGNSEYRDHAIGGARWLIDMANEPAPGQRSWVRVEGDPAPSTTWCGGTCGIVQFFIMMYNATGDSRYLDQAMAGGNWTLSQAVVMGPEQVSIDFMNMFCHGDPSQALVLFMLYEATGDDRYRTCAEQVMNWLLSQRLDVNDNESKWPHLVGGDDFITGLLMGNSGIGHSLIMSYDITGNRTYLDNALRSASWVENRSIEVSPGVEKWNHMEKIDETQEYCPGWYWGVAGIGQFLLEMANYWTPPDGIEINIDGNSSGADPGSEALHVMSVKNIGGAFRDIGVEVTQPNAPWSYELSFDGKDVGPGEVRELKLSVSIPTNASAGDYRTSRLKLSISGKEEVNETVLLTTFAYRVRALSLSFDAEIIHCSPGENATFIAEVTNKGNGVEDIGLTAVCEQLPLIHGPSVIFDGKDVSSGARRQASIRLDVPQHALANITYTVTLKAFNMADPSVFIEENVTVVVERTRKVYLSLEVDQLVIEPFTTISTMLHVRNLGNAPEGFVLEISDLGPDWNITAGMEDEIIPPNGSYNGNVSITLDRNMAPSTHRLVIMVRSLKDSSVNDSVTLVLDVPRFASVRIPSIEPGSAVPGEEAIYELELLSRSNIGFSIGMSVVSGLNWPVRWTLDNGTLSPGGNRSIWLYHLVPLSTPNGTVDSLTVTVQLSGGPTITLVINTTTRAVTGFSLALPSGWVKMTPGSSLVILLNLTNSGNVPLVLDLVLSGQGAEWVTLSEQRIEIGAGHLRTVSLTIDVPEGVQGTFPVVINATDRNTTKGAGFVLNVTSEGRPHTDRDEVRLMTMFFLASMSVVITIALVAIALAIRNRKNGDVETSSGPFTSDQEKDDQPYESWGDTDE